MAALVCCSNWLCQSLQPKWISSCISKVLFPVRFEPSVDVLLILEVLQKGYIYLYLLLSAPLLTYMLSFLLSRLDICEKKVKTNRRTGEDAFVWLSISCGTASIFLR